MTGEPRDGRLRAYAVVFAGTGCYTTLMFVWFSLPSYLSTIIEDVGLSGTQAGILAGAVPLTYIPLGLVSGLAVDRFGPGRSLAAGAFVFGLAQMGRSVAPGFPSLFALTLLVGVGATLITFGLPKLVGTLFPPDRLGLPTSIYLVGAAAGTASAFAIGRPYLGPWLGGWRELFFYTGLAAVAYAAFWLFASRFAPAGRGGDEDQAAGLTLASARRDLRVVLTHRELRLVVIVAAMYLFVVHGLQGWLPTILESRGLSPELAGQTTSLFVAATVVGIVVVPAAADRLGARRPAVIACGAVGFGGLVGLLVGGIGPLVAAGIVVAGVAVGGLSPLIRAIPPELDGVGAGLTGTAMGFAFTVGEIGGFGGPLLIGALRDLTGSFAVGLAVPVVCTTIVVVAGLAMGDV